MIQKYTYGTPFETEAVVKEIKPASIPLKFGTIDLSEGFCLQYLMEETDIVYGLGESNRGINKRGYIYVSNNTDDPNHTEDKKSLYGSHNFILISGKETFGLFFDYPSTITFDIGFTEHSRLTVTCEEANLNLYVITGDSAYDIVKQFRSIIGRSYIPPKFAFGFGQSRWGYATKEAAKAFIQEEDENCSAWGISNVLGGLANNSEDYKNFYHNINGQKIRHDKVHNLYGYNMTRAAGEAFERIAPDKRFLMFSRSSYIGMHRYGGIWTGDNKSWWSHLLLNIKMMPSLNMCGFRIGRGTGYHDTYDAWL